MNLPVTMSEAWIDPYGSIHSDQMRIEERFRRLDHDNLEFSMTLTDPKAYTGAWSGKKVLKLMNSSQQIQKGLWGQKAGRDSVRRHARRILCLFY